MRRNRSPKTRSPTSRAANVRLTLKMTETRTYTADFLFSAIYRPQVARTLGYFFFTSPFSCTNSVPAGAFLKISPA